MNERSPKIWILSRAGGGISLCGFPSESEAITELERRLRCVEAALSRLRTAVKSEEITPPTADPIHVDLTMQMANAIRAGLCALDAGLPGDVKTRLILGTFIREQDRRAPNEQALDVFVLLTKLRENAEEAARTPDSEDLTPKKEQPP